MKKLYKILIALLLSIAVCNTATAVNETKTVGATGANYATLMAAFADINLGALTGDVTLLIIDNTTETVQPALNASGTGAASYTSVTIYPTVSGKTISGNFAGANVYLNGADNVTIDGRVNRTGTTADLTITNNSRWAIAFYGGATNNTIRYCTLKGSMNGDNYGGVVHFNGQYGGAGNNANILEYNNITSTSNGQTCNAIYSQGYATGSVLNSDNIIRYNNIYDVWKNNSGSSFIKLDNYNSGWTILGNSMYNTTELAASILGGHGINISSTSGTTISNMTIHNNYIGGATPQCGGLPLTQDAPGSIPFRGIYVLAQGNNSIQGNTIKNISWKNSAGGSMFLIAMLGGNFDCGTTEANVLGAASGTGSILYTTGINASFSGIYMDLISASQTVNCQNNIIGSITTANTDSRFSVTTRGITLWNGVAGNVTISNNLIGSTDTPNSIFASSIATTANSQLHGILGYGPGNITISQNTISNIASAQITYLSGGQTIGIKIENGTNTITNNSIHHLSTSAPSTRAPASGNFASVTGIAISSTYTLPNTITGNIIYNLTNTSESFAGYVVGLSYYWGATQSTISQNYIYDLFVTGASSTNANIAGMYIYNGFVNLINNIVSLGGNTNTNAYGYYLNNAAATDNLSMYFNTCYLGGSLASGSATKSYGLYSAGTSGTRDFRNNLLVNARSTAGATSKHYAIYYGTTGGTFTANYNDYYVSGTGGMLGYYGGNKSTLALLRTATTKDVNSLNTNPLFANAGGGVASDYIPGTTLSGEQLEVLADYAGTTRANPPTIGAFEAQAAPAPTISSFTPTSAASGTTVTITGTNFTGATAVSFGGTAATSFSVVSATSITAVVGNGSTGSVSVTTPGGTATLTGFTFAQPMQLVFTTASPGQSIALPLYGTVNCTVDWGDGSATETFTTTGDKSHTFSAAGTHTVSISGSLTQFGKPEDGTGPMTGVAYLTEVTSFGNIGLTSLTGAFNKADNLTSVPAALPATVTDLSRCFTEIGRASVTNLNLWDVGNVTTMERMFSGATTFNQSLGTWDVSNVTTMFAMFGSTPFNQDISGWDVGNVTDMSWMFSGATAFDQSLAGWDIGSVTTMEDMFKDVTLSTANYDAMLIS